MHVDIVFIHATNQSDDSYAVNEDSQMGVDAIFDSTTDGLLRGD